jgi:hypothetical protein
MVYLGCSVKQQMIGAVIVLLLSLGLVQAAQAQTSSCYSSTTGTSTAVPAGNSMCINKSGTIRQVTNSASHTVCALTGSDAMWSGASGFIDNPPPSVTVGATCDVCSSGPFTYGGSDCNRTYCHCGYVQVYTDMGSYCLIEDQCQGACTNNDGLACQ